MKKFLTAFALCAVALGCNAGAEFDGELDVDGEGAVAEESHADRDDRADIPFRVLDFSVRSDVGSTETRRLFTSAASFRAYFGASPAGVDFSREWVAFYSAGVQRTGGYRASFTRVRPSGSGLTLKLTTRLESPGEGCIVTQALTRPMVLVAFRAPTPRPGYARFYRDDVRRDCTEGPSCATVRCAAGTHCELRPVTCVRAPCPPQPQCVPDENPCALIDCRPGYVCVNRGGRGVCEPGPADPCATVRCAAGTTCVVRDGRAVCQPTAPCPGAGTRNAATGQCECNALGVCIDGSVWNSDPSVCGCVPRDPCAAVRCRAGTACVVRDGRAVCEVAPGACLSDSDCHLYDNYCGGCACNALGHNQRPVTCTNPVMCFRQPCGGLVARCNTTTNRCEAAPAGSTGGVACGRTTCPSGQVCCNASCGICTPPGGVCIQLACS